MSALEFVTDTGVQASIESSGKLRLRGLSRLTAEQKNQIIDFARNHKKAILEALNRYGSSDGKSALPASCPFITQGPCPRGCRFETRLFARMCEQGVLPFPDVGCPFKNVCGLNH